MKLPDRYKLVVPRRKLTQYLLSRTHRVGKHKAAFFERRGFSTARWQELESALRSQAARHDVAKVEDSPFGTRYVIDGIIATPSGSDARIRSVWFVASGENVAQLVTAYPLKRNAR